MQRPPAINKYATDWYAALSPEEKYQAKAAIDTFDYRAGDALGAWAFDGFLRAAAGLGGTALLLAPLGLGWIALARGLGRMVSSRLDGAARAGEGDDRQR